LEQRGQQVRLFVWQCVAGAVEDRERRSRAVLEQVDSRRVPDSRVLSTGDDERRPPVRLAIGQGELPALADSLHCGHVGEGDAGATKRR